MDPKVSRRQENLHERMLLQRTIPETHNQHNLSQISTFQNAGSVLVWDTSKISLSSEWLHELSILREMSDRKREGCLTGRVERESSHST